MGYQMRGLIGLLAAVMLAATAPLTKAHAAGPVASERQAEAQPAIGVELWTSIDSDKTSVVKLLGRALYASNGPQQYQGFDVERAWFRPQGQHVRTQTRVYLDFAGGSGSSWKWSTRLGTNGDTIVGSASIRSPDWSKELFVEREVVETPRGLDQGIYYTFAGVSADLLSRGSDTLNVLAGVQKFTGRNDRLHLRGSFVHLIEPKLGLSLQLRARYFHSTVPGEFDYYSPRDFVQVIPVVQLRQHNHGGWMYLLAVGYGAQKATTSRWQGARLADLRIESPRSARNLQAFAQIQYSNNSLTGAAGSYNYVVARLGLTKRL